MSEPQAVSLADYGLWAPEGLDCREGGLHHILSGSLRAIAESGGGGAPACQKCSAAVILEPLTRLEG